MLVLTRKKDDAIVIGGNIEVKVLQVSGNRIRLGISAPNDVSIVRSELRQFGEPTELIQEAADWDISITTTAPNFPR